jgi:ATP-dependent DNA helicase RecQ
MIERAKSILKSVFGYDRFISLQKDVIENVLSGRDCLAVMPTGGGKSLCYQIPALIFDGLTIVVSPLISLMKDQVEQLTQLEIPAVLINSSISPETYRRSLERVRSGEAKLLYAAPETLLKPNMLSLLDSVPVSCLAIDEAHCISEWGPDFRPEYRQLAEVRARMPHAVCIALTATATPRVRKDIKASLGFDDSSEFLASFNRGNLFIRVVPKEKPFRQVVELLRKYGNDPGIIYCSTRKEVDDLCTALGSHGFSASPYHAGLSDVERNRNQEKFVRDDVRIIVATIAFGMGIDKSNIRFILHYDLPKNIESYYQEIGRAGRDGMRAECVLLFSYTDIHRIKYFITRKEGIEKRAANLQLSAMLKFAESDVCRRIPLLGYFGETFLREKCDMCDNCLAGERAMMDITIPAQKFLSCVKRTGERFGTMHVIDVLRGSKAGKVFKFGHEKLSTYGIGMELSRRQWQQVARQLLHKGLMVQDPEIGGLSLTPRARDVFTGKESVLGRLDDPKEQEEAPEDTAQGRESGYDRDLFQALRQKRKELAEAANVPPYVVFSDRTLAEMAAHLPRTAEGMLQIHGVGRTKLDRYGPIFLKVLEDYFRDHPVVEKPG